ncbi:hypothetical protein TRFO_26507 [Tritrichomonas foetus]|uniref:Nucleolar complex protein 2 n=1 Tax=Tritrichomonas foetus TaxID=1144522 RepID=A0A1J4K7F3_9EUKA|nr:hypothetical protein TRFO_26507 [Tritrichomonas foetus]|eukprot:OHT05630.1 hypothetical protein TRFO_26507 [Tritrichomonas foetus]
MSELKPFAEEEEYPDEDVEEEEEEVGELVVIDDELVESLLEGIESSNPNQLAQAVDVIIGSLGYKHNIILDEDLEKPPIYTILPKLIPKLTDLYNNSKEGSVKHTKVNHLLETLSAGVFDSFDKFKKDIFLFEIYCKGICTMKEFLDEKVANSAFVNASKVGLQKDSHRPIIFKMFGELVSDQNYTSKVLEMQFSELIKSNEQSSIENMLPSIIDFYLEHKEEVLPFVKSLVKRLSSELMHTMSQSDKSMISWRTLATIQLVVKYMIETKEQRLVYPVLLILTSFLRHFPIKVYLPFQIRIANITHNVSKTFGVYAPVLCWVTDSIQFLCSVNAKGGQKFNWETQLTSPQQLTFEFCHGALDQLKKIFFANLLGECESIAFPEYVMPIRKRLEAIVATKTQLSGEVKPLIHQIADQQQRLLKVKNEIEWKSRQEQLSAFQAKVDEEPTPLKTTLTKQSNIEAAKERMKSMKPKKQVDDTGDIVEVATADDV